MSIRLRELIRAVRDCTTQAQERSVIARESAMIRTSFAQNETQYKPRNIAKLLYIHMLGYNTQFGQMECISLVAQPEYAAKRIGYLGLMILLDEDQELLMMVTNSLRQDLKHPNQFVVGLALAALGNVASAFMARDVAPDIEELLSAKNAYIRKKAALCAVRVVRKCPDLAERYVGKVRQLLGERNHGVLVTAVQLLIDLCEADSANVSGFRACVPGLVRTLKSLVMSGYAPEYDIGGVTDPFLQVKVLRALRILGRRNAEASDQMNDILAQVATNTENLRNVGNAILYEAVQTIMMIDANEGLRVLAINLLGRFLTNRDNNIRYVALNSLSKVVHANFTAVQRHRAIIVDCLKDPDISIRRRALDLVYALVTPKNIKALSGELLGYLLVADSELRPDITARLCMVAQRFAPSNKWYVDTMLRVMSLAGAYIPEEVVSETVSLISQNADIQSYAVRRFYTALRKEPAKTPLVYVGLWTIGEYGDLLVTPPADGSDITVQEEQVFQVLKKSLNHPLATVLAKEYALTAAAKLSVRLSPALVPKFRGLIEEYTSSPNLSLQERSCEYLKVLEAPGTLKENLLDRLPPLVLHGDMRLRRDPGDYSGEEDEERYSSEEEDQRPAASEPSVTASLIPGLDDIISSPSSPSPSTAPVSSGGMSILDSIMGGGNTGGGAAPLAPLSSGGGGGGLDDILGLSSSPSPPVSAGSPAPALPTPMAAASSAGSYDPIVAFQKDGLKISMKFAPKDGVLFVQMISENSTQVPMTNFQIQMAVPTYIKLTMAVASGTSIPPGGSVTQQAKLENSAKPKPTLVKMKVDWKVAGKQVTEVVNVENFPKH